MESITITIKALRKHKPCQPDFDDFIEAMNGWPEDKPFPVARVIRLSKIEHAFWSLRAVKRTEVNERRMRHLAADCAEVALPIFERERPDDLRPRQAIEAARLFADGKIGAAARDAQSRLFVKWIGDDN